MVTTSGALIAMGRGREATDLLSQEMIADAITAPTPPWVLLIRLQAQLQLPNLGSARETVAQLEARPELSAPTAARVCCFAAHLHLREGAVDLARDQAGRGLLLSQDYYDTDLHTSLQLVLGRALSAQHQDGAAEEGFLFANRAASRSEARLLIIDAHLGLSITNLASGRFRPAEVAATIACGLAAQAGASPREADSYLTLARACEAAGNAAAAAQALQTAREIASRLRLNQTGHPPSPSGRDPSP